MVSTRSAVAAIFIVCSLAGTSCTVIEVGTAKELYQALASGLELNIVITTDLKLTRVPDISGGSQDINSLSDVLQAKWWGYSLEPRSGPSSLAIRGKCKDSVTLAQRMCDINLQQAHFQAEAIDNILFENIRLLNGDSTIIASNNVSLWIQNVTIEMGDEARGCGVIARFGAQVSITDTNFQDNGSGDGKEGGGGSTALCVTSANVVLKNCTFTESALVNGLSIIADADAVVVLQGSKMEGDQNLNNATGVYDINAEMPKVYSDDESQLIDDAESRINPIVIISLPADWDTLHALPADDDAWLLAAQQVQPITESSEAQ